MASTSSEVKWYSRSSQSMLFRITRWGTSTPFGTPVEPLVNSTYSGS